jgi:hypothetical protein
MHFKRNVELIHQVALSFVGHPPLLEGFMYIWHILLVSCLSLLHYVDDKSLL